MTKAKKIALKKWGMNLLFFSAPMLTVFFYQLSQGVALEDAIGLALLALWGASADLFKKIK